jgi:hypothetical protein
VKTLLEIKEAVASLTPTDQRELLRFLVRQLHSDDAPLPAPRTFSKEEMDAWIAEDEEDMRRFLAGS